MYDVWFYEDVEIQIRYVFPFVIADMILKNFKRSEI